ncbi:hypothetical protein J6D24_00460 [Candidatus Saccharibacteria bacterium]|nr:hypothetical protein [Candidatus Saccharibacteria bacterium]
MDPKQTEGQNGPSTLSTGANISRTMDDLNVNDRKSATSNSPFAKHQFNKIAPGTGDIIIGQPNGTISSAPGEKEPKINRGRLIQFGLIFGGIALVALVIFTVVMVIINNQPKKSSSNQNVVSLGYQEAFNRYANWMISGEDSSSVVTIPSSSSRYFVSNVLETNSKPAEFLETAKQYYDEFYGLFNKTDLTSHPALASSVRSSFSNLTLYLFHLYSQKYTSDDYLSYYLEHKDDSANSLKLYYGELNAENVSAGEYLENAGVLADAVQNLYSGLEKNGCIKNSTVDETCKNEMINALPEMRSAFDNLKSSIDKMQKIANVAINKTINGVKTISDELSNPTEEKEYKEGSEETEENENS